VSASFAEVEKLADWVIIESFNDSPWPWDGLTTVDAVLVAGPGVVFSYDPEKFRKASYLMSRGRLPIREVTFNRIVDLIRPLAHLRRKPGTDLTSDEVNRVVNVHGKE
jgi:predicted P-loop ATPase/GTPase